MMFSVGCLRTSYKQGKFTQMSDVTFTIRGQNQVTVTHEDAVKYVIDFLRNPRRHSYSDYGYDLYLNTMLTIYCQEKYGLDVQFSEDTRKIISPLFMDACWDLCRRGILRPFPRDIYGQGTSQGAGFSVTAFGKQWLQEKGFDDYVPTEPERFAELLAPYREHFGVGFYERAQQAVRCYGAHAYLACCAMCGAAAESVTLATAIAKSGDGEQVLKTYAIANGRMKIENQVIGQAAEHLKREFRGLTELIKYWRDEAAHGRTSGISYNEAYTSLASGH